MTGTGASYVVAGAERSSAVLKHDNWPNAELALCASRPKPGRFVDVLESGRGSVVIATFLAADIELAKVWVKAKAGKAHCADAVQNLDGASFRHAPEIDRVIPTSRGK